MNTTFKHPGNAMSLFRFTALALALFFSVTATNTAQAMYDPGTGQFLQRDPGRVASPGRPLIPRAGDGYQDGMNLTVGHFAMHGKLDPTGLAIQISARSHRVDMANSRLMPEGAPERNQVMAWPTIFFSWDAPKKPYHFVRISYDISGSDIIMSDSESMNDPDFRRRIESGIPYMPDPASESYNISKSWSFTRFSPGVELSVSPGPGFYSGEGTAEERALEFQRAWQERNAVGKGGLVTFQVEYVCCLNEDPPQGEGVQYNQGDTEDFIPGQGIKPNRIRTPREGVFTLVSGCQNPENEEIVDSGSKTLDWAVFHGRWIEDRGSRYYQSSLFLR